jgi:hypothetical protein
MASYGLPAFESPAPRANKDALHRILESVVTTNERLAGQEDRAPAAARRPPAAPQLVAAVPRFRGSAASWQGAGEADMYDVHAPPRALDGTADANFSGLFSSGAAGAG